MWWLVVQCGIDDFSMLFPLDTFLKIYEVDMYIHICLLTFPNVLKLIRSIQRKKAIIPLLKIHWSIKWLSILKSPGKMNIFAQANAPKYSITMAKFEIAVERSNVVANHNNVIEHRNVLLHSWFSLFSLLASFRLGQRIRNGMRFSRTPRPQTTSKGYVETIFTINAIIPVEKLNSYDKCNNVIKRKYSRNKIQVEWGGWGEEN